MNLRTKFFQQFREQINAEIDSLTGNDSNVAGESGAFEDEAVVLEEHEVGAEWLQFVSHAPAAARDIPPK